MDESFKYFPSVEGEELVLIQNLIQGQSKEQIADFASVYNARRRDPQTVLLTSLLGFLGVSGVHRFYLGQSGMGILYLLTAGLCGIGTIIDIFRHKALAMERNMQIANELVLQVRTVVPSAPSTTATPVSPVASVPYQARNTLLVGMTGPYAGQQIPVPAEGLVMGRDPSSCSLVIQSPSVSRTHARLSPGPSPDSWILEDLNSTNGTYVLDKSSWVRVTEPVIMTIFKRFRLGDSSIEFEIR